MAKAKSITVMRTEKRESFLEKLTEMLSVEEDVIKVASNGIAFPIVHEDGTEDYIKIVVSIPTKDFDPYGLNEELKMKAEAKAKKEAEAKAKKEKKIAEDKARREKKANA